MAHDDETLDDGGRGARGRGASRPVRHEHRGTARACTTSRRSFWIAAHGVAGVMVDVLRARAGPAAQRAQRSGSAAARTRPAHARVGRRDVHRPAARRRRRAARRAFAASRRGSARSSAFFMAFTHDLKTALASLQLQAESLQRGLPDAASNPNLDAPARGHGPAAASSSRTRCTSRSLTAGCCSSRFDARAARSSARRSTGPSLTRARRRRRRRALADARALESVLRNLFQNAVVHGGATRSAGVDVEQRPDGRDQRDRRATTGAARRRDVLRLLGQPFVAARRRERHGRRALRLAAAGAAHERRSAIRASGARRRASRPCSSCRRRR